MDSQAICMEPLEDMVDALLAEAPINQALIPDYIERKLYLNTLV